MGKTTKRIFKYIDGKLPPNLAELLQNADETDLKILVALMMAAGENGEVSETFSVADALGIDQSAVDAGIKFWRGAGVFATSRTQTVKTEKITDKPKADTAEPKQKAERAVEIAPAHRDGVLENDADISNYRTGELANVFENRMVTAEFVDEAQRILGRTFNIYDTNILVSLVDRLGMSEEAVLIILAYAKQLGKSTLRYCEKMAINLYDDGYTDAEAIVKRIAEIECTKTEIAKIKTLFGMGSRTLSKSEKAIFDKWITEFGYGTDVIKIAYDITVDSIQKPMPKYTSSILERWHAAGLKTAEEVEAYIQSEKDSKATAQKSYDLEDFAEAALKKSFEDLN